MFQQLFRFTTLTFALLMRQLRSHHFSAHLGPKA